MTATETQMLVDRLDSIDTKLGMVVEKVTAQVAICGPTRKRVDGVCATVYGNGGTGLKTEVAQLKTVSGMRSRGFWVVIGLISTVVSGTVLAVGSWVVALM